MRVLYVGDIMGDLGIAVIEKQLQSIKDSNSVDLVIAQSENVSQGKGITPEDFERLRKSGIDFFTGGNHSLSKPAIEPLINDPNVPIIRPANYPISLPGLGYKYIIVASQEVLVISLLGQVVGVQAKEEVNNPLKVIDRILAQEIDHQRAATVVNFHGDYSSEKIIMGHYLDGRVSMLVGDHWHVPTADAQVLPKGTAYISDVGMCGALDSSLGIKFDTVVRRWRDQVQTPNILETEGRTQLNALLVDVADNGLASSVELIHEIYEVGVN